MSTVVRITRCSICRRAHPALQECSHHICGTCGEWHSKDLECKPAPEVLMWIIVAAIVCVIGVGWLILHTAGSA